MTAPDSAVTKSLSAYTRLLQTESNDSTVEAMVKSKVCVPDFITRDTKGVVGFCPRRIWFVSLLCAIRILQFETDTVSLPLTCQRC